MKKQILLLACAAIVLASCGGENKPSEAETQAKIDSAVKAKEAEQEAAMAAKNDSTVRAMEAAKAAELEAAKAAEAAKASSTKKSGKTTKTTKETKTTTPTPPPPANPSPARFNEGDNNAAPAPNAESKNKKADRFK